MINRLSQVAKGASLCTDHSVERGRVQPPCQFQTKKLR